LSYQKIPDTAYKVSADLENGNRKIMQEEERDNRKEKYENVDDDDDDDDDDKMPNDDDNDNDNDRCLQCVTVSEYEKDSLQAIWS